MRKLPTILFLTIILILSIVPCQASAQEEPTHLLVNSDSWIDVYSGLLYAHLTGLSPKFLISDMHSRIILKNLPDNANIFVLESADSPYIMNIADTFSTMGFTASEVMKSSDPLETNLELAERSGASSFIIVDDSYGYNALAVGPYAVLTDSFVLFADDQNIDDVAGFLNSADVDSVLLYGTLGREIKDRLARFNPEIINTGNRFDDNIELVKRHRQIKDTKQVMLSNGEFIEESLLSGGNNNEPVLYVGRDTVPDQVVKYLKESNTEVGVLVGNELMSNAKSLKEKTGISIFVKFAQGTAYEGTFEEIRDLEKFPMPSYALGISIENINYNTETKQLEVIYNNERDMIVYFKSTFDVMLNNEKIGTVGDEEPMFLDEEETLGVAYDIDISSRLAAAEEKNLTIDVYTIFGESPRSLGYVMSGTVPAGFKEVADASSIRTRSVAYDQKIQRFIISVENTGDVDAYANVNLVGLTVNDLEKDVGAPEPAPVPAGRTVEIRIKQRMDEVDLADNEQVDVVTYYGERENVLLNQDRGTFDLTVISSTDYTKIVAVVVIILVVLGALFFFSRRKGKIPKGEKK